MRKSMYQKLERYEQPESYQQTKLNTQFSNLKNKLHLYWQETNGLISNQQTQDATVKLSQLSNDMSLLDGIRNKQMRIFESYVMQNHKLRPKSETVINLFKKITQHMQLCQNQVYNILHYINQNILNCLDVTSLKSSLDQLKIHINQLRNGLLSNKQYYQYLLIKQQVQIQKQKFISVVQHFQTLLGNSVLLYRPFSDQAQNKNVVNRQQQVLNYDNRFYQAIQQLQLAIASQQLETTQINELLSQLQQIYIQATQFSYQCMNNQKPRKNLDNIFNNQHKLKIEIDELLDIHEKIKQQASQIHESTNKSNLLIETVTQSTQTEYINDDQNIFLDKPSINDQKDINIQFVINCEDGYKFTDINYIRAIIAQITQHVDKASCLFIYKKAQEYVKNIDFNDNDISNWDKYIEFYILNQQQPQFNLGFIPRSQIFPIKLYNADQVQNSLEKLFFDCCVMHSLLSGRQGLNEIIDLMGLSFQGSQARIQ